MVSLDWGSMRHMKDIQLRYTTNRILIQPAGKVDVQHGQSIVPCRKGELIKQMDSWRDSFVCLFFLDGWLNEWTYGQIG